MISVLYTLSFKIIIYHTIATFSCKFICYLQALSKDLAWKEALAAKLIESNSIESSIKGSEEVDITELKAQLDSLQHEKEELEQQLKTHRNVNIDHK